MMLVGTLGDKVGCQKLVPCASAVIRDPVLPEGYLIWVSLLFGIMVLILIQISGTTVVF